MNTGRYDYKIICDYVIGYCQLFEKNVTNLQLQKILYYVQGYSLKYSGTPAFDSVIEAWQYGPVVPEAYYDYCINGRNPLTVADPENAINRIDEKSDRKILNKIIKACTEMAIGTLVDKTHKEDPWKNTSGFKGVISVDKIYHYFSEHDPLDIGE